MSQPEKPPMTGGGDQEAHWAAPELPADFKAIEARLAALCPRDDRLNRERLMFLAGRASVEKPSEVGDRIPRAWLESKAWPGAFAGMTAVAAALLVALFVRPVVDGPAVLQIAGDNSHATVSQSLAERVLRTNGDVLSPGDVRRGDIEMLLSGAPLVAAVDAPNAPRNEQDRATLTPGAWRRLLEGAEAAHPGSNDSSDARTPQGITS